MVRLLLILALLVFLSFYNLGLNAVWQPNEAFYAETARELLVNGDWLNLTYNGEPRLNKPPATYWATALSFKHFGLTEFALRLVPFLSALGTALLLILYGWRLKSFTFGVVSSIIVLSSLQVFALARYDSPEMPLLFTLTGALIFLHLYDLGGKFKYLWLLLSGVFLSWALLVKGIPFLAIYLGVWFLYKLAGLFVERNFSLGDFLKSQLPVWFIGALASLPVLGWYWWAYQHYGELFIKTFYSEVIHRALNEQKGLQPFFYLVVILWAFLPYSLHFYYSLLGLLTKNRHLLNPKGLLFPLVWFAVVLAAFTVAKGKIPVYILPAFPAMALLTARLYDKEHPVITVLNWSILLITTGVFFYLLYTFGFYQDSVTFAVLLLSLTLWFTLKGSDILRNTVAVIPFLFLFVHSVLPFVEKYRPYKPLFAELNNLYPKSEYKLVCLRSFFKNFPFYRRDIVPIIRTAEELKKFETEKVLLFAPKPLNGWKVVKEVELYTGSESRFLVMLKDIKKHKRFRKFYFLVKE